jgi:hypothetical protein
MFLSYLALAILLVMIVVIVYLFIWIHDIPYRMAQKRNHPNLHAIHIACWLSLFTLHALWPFVFIWAIAQRPRFEVMVVNADGADGGHPGHGLVPHAGNAPDDIASLRTTIAQLQQRLDAIELRQREGGNS